jgi:hypothetical protein
MEFEWDLHGICMGFKGKNNGRMDELYKIYEYITNRYDQKTNVWW